MQHSGRKLLFRTSMSTLIKTNSYNPMHFNFAVDVVGYWAKSSNSACLISADETNIGKVKYYKDIYKVTSKLGKLLPNIGVSLDDRVIVMLTW